MNQNAPDATSMDIGTIYPRLIKQWTSREISEAISTLDKNDGTVPSECDIEAYLLANSLGVKPSLVMTRKD